MNVLVTGGAGYIGSHTAKALALAGHTPVVYDNLSRGHRNAVQWGPLVEGELEDLARLSATLKANHIDAIFHFAAYAYVGESMQSPGRYFENNTFGTLRLLEAARDAGVRYFVFSSTCATYGHPVRLPIDETHSQIPVNPYGESKLMIETILKWYAQIHGTRWVALRYFNAAGCDPDGDLGERHAPETHLIPLVLSAALNKETPVSIFGTDYDTPDGTAVRDYIHVTDLADAHLRALDYLVDNGGSRAFNLGTGKGHSVQEIVDAVQTITGLTPNVRREGRRAGDPAILIADATQAASLLGWKAVYSDLATLIKTAYKYKKASLSLEKGYQ